MERETQKNIDSWLKGDVDEETKETIRQLQQKDPEGLADAFYCHLSFGTGGLRGLMGVGTNRMNLYTIRTATQGLANYILQLPSSTTQSVCIGFDSRHHSHAFAQEAAAVLAGNGITVFLYDSLRPVAAVSFGILYNRCTAGIMITASHNPPLYNGYKIYWSYGGQVLPPHDRKIIEEVEKVTLSAVKRVALPHPLVHSLSTAVDKAYLQAISAWQLHPTLDQTRGGELHVFYTNLHGTGSTLLLPALQAWGFTHVTSIAEQAKPDGDFPTITSPNPEEHATMAIGVGYLEKQEGDLLLGTDPDADRLGVVVRHQKQTIYLDGNQTAALLLEHLCRSLHKADKIPPRPVVIKTIVTSELLQKIAHHYGAECLDVLTGFKYVGEKIYQWEKGKDKPHFLFGAEESYGYLIGTHVRDKDAMIAAASICEAALTMKCQGKTLIDLLHEIYHTYGIHRDRLLSVTLPGAAGAEKITQIMDTFRRDPPHKIHHIPVERVEDYLLQYTTDSSTGARTPITLPRSNVLRFWLADQSRVTLRPSGTEPKIKLYCSIAERPSSTGSSIEEQIKQTDARLDGLSRGVQEMLTQISTPAL